MQILNNGVSYVSAAMQVIASGPKPKARKRKKSCEVCEAPLNPYNRGYYCSRCTSILNRLSGYTINPDEQYPDKKTLNMARAEIAKKKREYRKALGRK